MEKNSFLIGFPKWVSKVKYLYHHCVLIDFDITLDCEECIFQTIEYRTDKSMREKHIQSRISIISQIINVHYKHDIFITFPVAN
jgi:hypothetical protein